MKTAPTRTFAEYFWTLKNSHGFAPSLCITIGTDGGKAVTALAAAWPKALHVVIEHIKDDLELAKTRLASVESKLIQAAALEKPGAVAVSEGKVNLLKARISGKGPGKGKTVKAVPLDEIVAPLETRGPSLIKIDYRGAELRALAGATETLLSCDVVVIKAALHKLWGDGHPEFADIVKTMKEQGFVVHDFLNGLFRPVDRALGVIDVAFIRQDGVMYGNRNWFK